MTEADVYFDGKYLGNHYGGFTSFEYILENETMDLIRPDKYGVDIDGNHKLSNAKFLIILANHVLTRLEETCCCDDLVSMNIRG